MEKSILPVEEVPEAGEHDGGTSGTSNRTRDTRRFTRVDYHPIPDRLSLHFHIKLHANRDVLSLCGLWTIFSMNRNSAMAFARTQR